VIFEDTNRFLAVINISKDKSKASQTIPTLSHDGTVEDTKFTLGGISKIHNKLILEVDRKGMSGVGATEYEGRWGLVVPPPWGAFDNNGETCRKGIPFVGAMCREHMSIEY
jgi:hypothetical protein